MKKMKDNMIWQVLLVIIKIIFAIPAVLLFVLIRCLQFFLKMCGTVVSFVCIVSAVMVSMGAFVEILLQIRGNGPGIPAIILTMAVAGGLFYVPVVGVAMVMVLLEAICSWMWKFFLGEHAENWKSFYKRPDYQWSAFEDGYKGKHTDDAEFHIHYFRGIKTSEELKKRYYALLKIYHPDNAFGEDEITRSIMEEYDYLKNRLPEKN